MRKTALLLAFCFCFIIWGATVVPPAEMSFDFHEETAAAAIYLPASLKEIGESAFENTSIEAVVIPDAVHTVGERAFADNPVLAVVYFPESVTCIGDHAFDGSPGVTLRGTENSYAAAWARAHQIAFLQTETTSSVWIKRIIQLLRGGFFLSMSLGCVCPQKQYWQRRERRNRRRSMRPQDRPEMLPINYRFP